MNTTANIRTKSDNWDTTGVVRVTNGDAEVSVRVEADADGIWVYVESDNGWDSVETISAKHFTWDQFNAVDPTMWR